MTNPSLTHAMFALLRSALSETPVAESDKKAIQANPGALYTLAKRQDLAHMVGYALSKQGLLDLEHEVIQKFEKQQFLALYRYEQSQYELTALSGALEEEGIPFLPLKGAVIRPYYPEPWMRTSCDLDILVHKESLREAADALTRRLGYQSQGVGAHDLSMYTPAGVHIELHFELWDEDREAPYSELLKQAWDYAEPAEGCQYQHILRDEMYYYYHMAHMAKHLEDGGCGVRPFLDLWLLTHRLAAKAEARQRLLKQGGLAPFDEAARRLCEVWFSEAEHDELSLRLEQFLLQGGVYGNQENYISIHQEKEGGKLAFALRKIFLPYSILKIQYPVCAKHKWLTPICELRRWGKLIFCGGVKRSVRELQVNASVTPEQVRNANDLLRQIGL